MTSPPWRSSCTTTWPSATSTRDQGDLDDDAHRRFEGLVAKKRRSVGLA
jgi:hypothetical protein